MTCPLNFSVRHFERLFHSGEILMRSGNVWQSKKVFFGMKKIPKVLAKYGPFPASFLFNL